MTEVDPRIRTRLKSGQHTGAARPVQLMQVRRGRFQREFKRMRLLDGSYPEFGYISKSEQQRTPWQATWEPDGPWITVPNVASVDLTHELSDDGVAEPSTATIEIANTVWVEKLGTGGAYRELRDGYMAPWYGSKTSQPRDPRQAANQWQDVLNAGFEVRVLQGYGNAVEPTFAGLIDQADSSSAPSTITLTCRSFGLALTDQRIFGDAKAHEVRPPIIFCDRLKADDTTKVGSAARASSAASGYPATAVSKVGDDDAWLSAGHNSPAVTEWVQISLPAGRYEDFYLAPEYRGMEVYVSIYSRGVTTVDGQDVDEGWVTNGSGSVPGTNGGHPYVKRYGAVDEGGQTRRLPFRLICGDNTILRVSFRNLYRSPGKGDYRAKVSRLTALKRKRKEEANNKGWILIDDASDMVKWALMWAGFKEWRVKKLGIRIKEPTTFHQADYLVDIIKRVCSTAGFVFHIDQPSDHPDSIGVPVFEPTGVLSDAAPLERFSDREIVERFSASFTKEPLSYIVRVRGREQKEKEGGVQLGEDTFRRVQAIYRTPWSGTHNGVTGTPPAGAQAGRLAGILKHVVYTLDELQSEAECMMACIQIAQAEAVAAFTGSCETYGHPGISLNAHVVGVDAGAGINNRMWVSRLRSTFTTGPEGTWRQTIDGCIVDTPDIQVLARDYQATLRKALAEVKV